MACYHPLKGFIVGKTENGKKDLCIAPYDTECVFQPYGSETWERHGHVLDRLTVHGRVVTDFVPITCGQCVGCRLEYSRQWAVRCMLESEYYDDNYFITLTYSEDTVPKSEYIDEETGEIKTSLTLNKKDVQDFIKRLRRHFDYRDSDGFRYFCCGEYGTESARPHYHMIAFGLHLDKSKLKLYRRTPYGDLYTHELLTEKWNKGHVIVGGVSFESCSYVSRYIMKKQKGKGADVYSKFNISPEYVVMSRNPGIAKEYFQDNFDDIYSSDSIVISGGKLSTPPRYFDNLMNEIDEELMSDIKERRVDIATSIQAYKDTLTTADYQKQLEYAENNKEARVKKLVRSLE